MQRINSSSLWVERVNARQVFSSNSGDEIDLYKTIPQVHGARDIRQLQIPIQYFRRGYQYPNGR